MIRYVAYVAVAIVFIALVFTWLSVLRIEPARTAVDYIISGVDRLIKWSGLSYEPLYWVSVSGNCTSIGDRAYHCYGNSKLTFRVNTTDVVITVWSDGGMVAVGRCRLCSYFVEYATPNSVKLVVAPTMKTGEGGVPWIPVNVTRIYGGLDIYVYGMEYKVYYDVRPRLTGYNVYYDVRPN